MKECSERLVGWNGREREEEMGVFKCSRGICAEGRPRVSLALFAKHKS